MGFSKKAQAEGVIEAEGKKWVIAGIAIRAPLRSITTKQKERQSDSDDEASSTTPTTKESRIPEKFPCPPAPQKRRSSSKCQYNGTREFFNPPDLESVFVMRQIERAN
ncbi:Cyclin-dependent protein kinase [Actinidia chinensis var. chinensis]|uniref:Cyclin-dependent protein kinase n=1 Tax=Actinidia chinensis var. chinensis TaxID=1590841 RepID=A0A2R6RK33_ACTCC|nr:Cyclin-dependent protein kinase [Actinidia chinensis var. chinensis]